MKQPISQEQFDKIVEKDTKQLYRAYRGQFSKAVCRESILEGMEKRYVITKGAAPVNHPNLETFSE